MRFGIGLLFVAACHEQETSDTGESGLDVTAEDSDTTVGEEAGEEDIEEDSEDSGVLDDTGEEAGDEEVIDDTGEEDTGEEIVQQWDCTAPDYWTTVTWPTDDPCVSGTSYSITDLVVLPSATSLQGLECLCSASTVSIENNDHIDNMQGLNRLEYISNLTLRNNDGLVSLDGFDTLFDVYQLDIENNDALENIDSLQNTYIMWSGSVVIADNPSLLTVDGLASVSEVDVDIIIRGNEQLLNVDGLVGVTSVNSLQITDNDSLLNLDALYGVGFVEYVNISENDSLLSVDGLVQLQADTVVVQDNSSLCQSHVNAWLSTVSVWDSTQTCCNHQGC